MTTLNEDELEFSFPPGIPVQKFDGPAHSLSHCMKAVDFIAEFPNFWLFVEVKDPSTSKAEEKQRRAYLKKLQSNQLTPELAQKYRDAWLYKWAETNTVKPIKYAVLLELEAQHDLPLLQTLAENLKRAIPARGPSNWTRQIVSDVLVLNMDKWNDLKVFGQVRRV